MTEVEEKLNQEADGESDMDFELYRLLDHARFAVARPRGLELGQFGLTREQTAILYTLINNGGSTTMKEIADVTMRQHHTISTIIARMEKLKLVKKSKKGKNKSYNISITKEGYDTYSKVPRRSIHMAFSVLTEKEKKNLTVYLQKLIDNGRKMMGLDKPSFLQ